MSINIFWGGVLKQTVALSPNFFYTMTVETVT